MSTTWLVSAAAAAEGMCVARVTGAHVERSCRALGEHERLRGAPPPLHSFTEGLILVDASDGRVSAAILGEGVRFVHFQAHVRGFEPYVAVPVPARHRGCAMKERPYRVDKDAHRLLDAVVAELSAPRTSP